MKLLVLRAGLAACALALTGCVTQTGPAPSHPERDRVQDPNVAVAPQLVDVMRRITLGLVHAGMQPAAQAFAGFLPNGNHATFPVRVPANTCATVVAVATKNVSDVDAALYTPEGELVVADAEPDSHPTLQVCAGPDARNLYYVIQLYDGDGSFVVLPFYGPRATLGAAVRVMGGRPAFAEAAASRELFEDPLSSLREGMRKRGFLPASEPLSFSIGERERVRTELTTDAATCYTVAAFGSEGVSEVGLRVLDKSGLPVGEGETAPGQSALQLCAHQRDNYVVETEALTGTGRVTLLVFRADVVVAGGDAGLWLGHRAGAKAPGR